MQQNQQPRTYYNTRRAATVLGGILPASLATALYRHGHYCGLVPARLPNGRLLWPADEIDALAAGARASGAPAVGERLAAGRKKAACVETGQTRPQHPDDTTGRGDRHRGFVAPQFVGLLAIAASVWTALVTVGTRWM